MFQAIEDVRIQWTKVVLPPVFLEEELPISEAAIATIFNARLDISRILGQRDPRLLVLVGPCSIHDTKAAREYAGLLRSAVTQFSADLHIVMRVFFEKPRTTIGWKGLINDPYLDQSYKINDGLRLARHLLLDLAEMGVPTGTEFLDMISPQYVAGLVSWGAIGARTTESQVHRQLASGLSMPIGFKNGTDGDVQVAVDACRASGTSHTFFGVTPAGAAAVVTTAGNIDTHVILRGGRSGPNYSAEHVSKALDLVSAVGLPRRLMVDASHGNSSKDYSRQPAVCTSLADQVTGGERGLIGVMMESFLVAGRQEPGDPATLTYGQSVTDACMDLSMTTGALERLASSVARRRGL